MSAVVSLNIDEALGLTRDALIAHRTSASNAESTARALVRAEMDGQKGHGLVRLATYCAQSLAGKVDGFACPEVEIVGASAVRIDARCGFAFKAIDLAIDELTARARQGVAIACVHDSHHFGQAGAHVERLAERGLIGMMFGNTPKAIAPWGGSRPLLGTNPIAFAAPLEGREPLVIDLSLSVVARGKIFAASRSGNAIPSHWALDRDGHPTEDPAAALQGSMLPIGDAKGAALAVMVEILAAALTASSFGFEASSVLDAEGAPPRLGQTLLAIDPQQLSAGQFGQRMRTLVCAIEEMPGCRLPGMGRLQHRRTSVERGLQIERALYREILDLAAPSEVERSSLASRRDAAAHRNGRDVRDG